MLFRRLLAELLKSGESACQAARLAYVDHLHELAGRASALPGAPKVLAVAPLGPFLPASMTLKTRVVLSMNGDDLEARCVGRWPPTSTQEATLTITWELRSAPEGVSRVVDVENLNQDGKLKKGTEDE